MYGNTFLIIACLFAVSARAAEPRDPRFRDEDISATRVSVNVRHAARGDGLYEYIYSVNSPRNNRGIIQQINIDLSCARENVIRLPEAETEQGSLGHYSVNGLQVPAIISADYGEAFLYRVSGATRKAAWGLSLKPGERSTGLRLLSAAAPAFREYELVPWMDNSPGWAYPETPDPDIPWIPNFTVTGVIAAPGCPNESRSLDDPGFAGASEKAESDAFDALMTYRSPLMNRFHVPGDTENLTIDIVYSEYIDSATFTVEPGSLREHFHPAPGTQESVSIPLHQPRMLIRIGVDAADTYRERHSDKKYYQDRDRDTFEIRKDWSQKSSGSEVHSLSVVRRAAFPEP